MDLYCAKCGEPWDNDTFHDVADENGSTYAEVAVWVLDINHDMTYPTYAVFGAYVDDDLRPKHMRF